MGLLSIICIFLFHLHNDMFKQLHLFS